MLMGSVAEIALKETMHKRLGDLEGSYKAGAPHTFSLVARAGIGLGAGLLAARGRSDRRAAVAAGVLVNVGALAARWSIYKAGFVSAARPDDTVVPQRRRIAAGRARGAARRLERA
jgi:hypothetical protein